MKSKRAEFVVKLKNDINISETGVFTYLQDLPKLEMGAEYKATRFDIGFLLNVYVDKDIIILPAIWFEFLSNKILSSKDYEILKNIRVNPLYGSNIRSVELVSLNNRHSLSFILLNGDKINTPTFPIGQMFCGMEINKEYTLEELGVYE